MKFSINVFGSSHDSNIGINVKGLSGIKFSNEYLNNFIKRRKPSIGGTGRIENDIPIFKGVKNNVTSNDFSIIFENVNQKSSDYNNLYGKPRPGHSDLGSYLKDGTLDFTGGGRFSGRMTLPIVALGGILKEYLESLGTRVESYISSIGNIEGPSYKKEKITIDRILENRDDFPSLGKKDKMIALIAKARKMGDTLGGDVECVISGLKPGVGDFLFDGLESHIASNVFAIPSCKGVEFGLGFDLAKMNGSKSNSSFYINEDKIYTKENNQGGILGGISTYDDILFRAAFKPIPSILKEQGTVDLVSKKECDIKIQGRHDITILPRVLPIVESMACIGIVELM